MQTLEEVRNDYDLTQFEAAARRLSVGVSFIVPVVGATSSAHNDRQQPETEA